MNAPHSSIIARAALCGSLLFASLSASAALVTSRAGLAGTDFIDWGQLGPAFTSVSNPSSVTSNLGTTASVGLPSGTMERRDQSTSWAGVFAPGAQLLWTASNAGPLTIDFAVGLSAIGAQIQSNFYGSFNGVITAYDAVGTLLESYSVAGMSSPASDDSAIFIGIARAAADIDHITFNITDNVGIDFAINRLDFVQGGGQVPEPGSLALIGLGLAAAALSRRRRQAA